MGCHGSHSTPHSKNQGKVVGTHAAASLKIIVPRYVHPGSRKKETVVTNVVTTDKQQILALTTPAPFNPVLPLVKPPF